jgi:hypothetical protein
MKDIDYERQNTYYDNLYEQNHIKCRNNLLCNNGESSEYFFEFNYFCLNCKIFEWNQLEFKTTDEECVVCYSQQPHFLKFPTNCGHWLCIQCSRDILFLDESRYHLNPVEFGCPPCPNGCINPSKGQQCWCDEF